MRESGPSIPTNNDQNGGIWKTYTGTVPDGEKIGQRVHHGGQHPGTPSRGAGDGVGAVVYPGPLPLGDQKVATIGEWETADCNREGMQRDEGGSTSATPCITCDWRGRLQKQRQLSEPAASFVCGETFGSGMQHFCSLFSPTLHLTLPTLHLWRSKNMS